MILSKNFSFDRSLTLNFIHAHWSSKYPFTPSPISDAPTGRESNPGLLFLSCSCWSISRNRGLKILFREAFSRVVQSHNDLFHYSIPMWPTHPVDVCYCYVAFMMFRDPGEKEWPRFLHLERPWSLNNFNLFCVFPIRTLELCRDARDRDDII
jgi:hypothetical protein